MLCAVKIKEEPLDETEDFQEQTNEELLEKASSSNNFNIVEERESIITVSAADMRSEEELRFIDSINDTDVNQFRGLCTRCLKSFTNVSQYLRHTNRSACVKKEKCPACPVTFIDPSSLLNHLNLHRENNFFCSTYCGSSYSTLSLCEEHELKEHRIQASPKICYKYFCSFCREGFKTELQLHVHWLQPTEGCGKLMQDVALHSSNVVKIFKTNVNTTERSLLDSPLQTTNVYPVSTIPITKLRLKCAATSTLTGINKRQNNDNSEEIASKRLKTIEEIKSEMETNEQPFKSEEAEIKIKEEPVDDYETSMSSSLIPEVIIKTEEEDKPEEQVNQKPLMTSLLINNMFGPESTGKFIPLENFVPVENEKTEQSPAMKSRPEMKTFSINNVINSNINGKVFNINLQGLPVLKNINNNVNNIPLNNIHNNIKKESKLKFVKIAPAPMPMTIKPPVANFNPANIKNYAPGTLMNIKLANGQSINNSNIKPLPKSGLQIIKFLPNTQLMTIKANNSNNNNSLLFNKEPVIVKLKTPPTIITTMPNLKLTSTTSTMATTTASTLITTTPIIKACSPSIQNPCTSTTLSIKLNSLVKSTTICAEDFKKLQAEAIIKAEEHRKNLYIPKTRLMIIENIPERKQLIDSMKQKIAEVQNKTTEQIQGKPAINYVLNTKRSDEPPSLYLPVLTTMDESLVQARYKNPNYNYKWICPYCLKDYEIKTALRLHLVKSHNLTNRDMEKINVQAKPYIYEEIAADSKLNVKEEPITQDTDSQSLPATSETESLITENTSPSSSSSNQIFKATQQCRPRYACDICGRICSSKAMLNNHILANCSREPQFSCKECAKKFFSHGALQRHMSIHTGELPHKCNYCDKSFRTRGQVKVHHRTHTGERPFFCQVCSQRFTHRETLIAHLSRHIGMKRYKCYGCDKHFSCISALKTHRDLRADTCGKVKFNPRAIGPRVRVVRGNVIFEPQPKINPYLKSEDPKNILSELQNQTPPQLSQ